MPPKPSNPYNNRELSWLAFNRRVLEQAQNPRHPLLERVRFLTIVSSNLDEFFEIRVAGLIQIAETNRGSSEYDEPRPRETLQKIHEIATQLVRDQYECWQNQLHPALIRENIVCKKPADLTRDERRWLANYFETQVFPVLTPLSVDPSHPFPLLGNKTLNIALLLDHPDNHSTQVFAIIPVPRILPRIVPIDNAPKNSPQTYIFLGEIIKLFAAKLFPGCTLRHAAAFRVTRNSDLYIDEEEAINLIKTIEEELRNLRRGAAVRLEIENDVPPEILATLCDHLGLSPEYVYKVPRPINLLRLNALCDIARPDLKFPPHTPANNTPLNDPARIFSTLRKQDILLHHPYDSFLPVVEFIEQAARDPQVLAIKQTLYRTSGDSPIVRALIEASQNGKQVTALVELKARGDEANNIQWARQLEEAGVHVVYGIIGYKIHCKVALVIRKEGRQLRRYLHLGTGNYNPRTARQYTDLGLLTTDTQLTADAAKLFNTLTGLGRAPTFAQLYVAPYNLEKKLLRRIHHETAAARDGKPARIILKMNALVEQTLIDALYEASQAGVKIELIIRGTCCLVPGIKGVSENIRVRSILGRFLEHARVCYFQNHGGKPVILAGSADWMPRNIHRRVEILFPVDSPAHRRWISEELLASELRDNLYARELQPDNTYRPVRRAPNEKPFSAQQYFLTDKSPSSPPTPSAQTPKPHPDPRQSAVLHPRFL